MAANERDNKEGGIIRVSKMKNPKRRSSSTTSSTYPSSSSTFSETDLDAVDILMNFGQVALLRSGSSSTTTNGESDRKWGNKGRRSVKRVKTESPSREQRGKSVESLKIRSCDVAQDTMVNGNNKTHKEVCENVRVQENVIIRTVKAEQNPEISRSRILCSTSALKPFCSPSPSFGGGRSKIQLTEAEKEARRMRRILANRESARQTIRRRQAMCEELARKAAALEVDNESLKREKELAMKEYESLKDRHKQLKEQIARKRKAVTEEVPEEVPQTCPSTNIKGETSAEKPPVVVYNNPVFAPFVWPSIVQPLNPVPNQPIPQNATSSQDPMGSSYKLSHEQGNPVCPNGLRPPFYIMPCSWFIPFPEHANGLFPHPRDPCASREKQGDTFVDTQPDNGSSMQTIKVENNESSPEKNEPSLPTQVKADTSYPTQPKPHPNPNNNNLPESSTKQTNGDSYLSSYHRGKIHVPTIISSHKPTTTTVKCENGHQQNSVPKEESASSTSGHSTTAFPESMLGQSSYPSKVDAASAAEARKRRKELTKVKYLNGRQHLRC